MTALINSAAAMAVVLTMEIKNYLLANEPCPKRGTT